MIGNSSISRSGSLASATIAAFAAVAVIALATAVLSGCGKKSPELPPAIAQAVEKFEQQGPTRIEGNFAFGQFKSDASGTVNLASRQSRLVSPIPGLGKIDSILYEDRAYINQPALFSKSKKPWVEINLIDPPTTGSATQLLPATSNGPEPMLEHLRGAVAAKQIGTEPVLGKPATHYLVTIDLKLAAKNAPPEYSEVIKASIDRTIKALNGSTNIKSDVWIGDSGDLLRQRTSLAFGSQSYTHDLTYLGPSDQSIEPPPESRVTNAAEL